MANIFPRHAMKASFERARPSFHARVSEPWILAATSLYDHREQVKGKTDDKVITPGPVVARRKCAACLKVRIFSLSTAGFSGASCVQFDRNPLILPERVQGESV
jgi:hypothetical protein